MLTLRRSVGLDSFGIGNSDRHAVWIVLTHSAWRLDPVVTARALRRVVDVHAGTHPLVELMSPGGVSMARERERDASTR